MFINKKISYVVLSAVLLTAARSDAGVTGQFSVWGTFKAPIWPDNNADFCFLTMLQGKYDGWGEFAHVWREGGSWWLGTQTGQPGTGMEAGARCVTAASFREPFADPVFQGEWIDGGGSYDLYDYWDTRGICYLSYASGALRDYGSFVKVVPSWDGIWHTFGNGVNGGQVKSGTTCAWPGNDVRLEPTPFNVSSSGARDVAMIGRWDGICWLAAMEGRFEGGGERAEIIDNPWDGLWHLTLSTQQPGTSVTAYCAYYD